MKKAKIAITIMIFIIVLLVSFIVFLLLKSDKKVVVTDKVKKDIKIEKIISVPKLSQFHEIPTGCEGVAATMVLQYYGVDISAVDFTRNWLECSEAFYSKNGILYGPNPDEFFVGNPFSENAYGCFSNTIVKAINKNCITCVAQEIKDKSLFELCSIYIKQDKPLLIWATMGMKPSKSGKSWCLDDGSQFTWIAGEHCLVFVGFNDNYYFFNDPQSASTVAFDKEICEKRFAELGKRALYIYKK